MTSLNLTDRLVEALLPYPFPSRDGDVAEFAWDLVHWMMPPHTDSDLVEAVVADPALLTDLGDGMPDIVRAYLVDVIEHAALRRWAKAGKPRKARKP